VLLFSTASTGNSVLLTLHDSVLCSKLCATTDCRAQHCYQSSYATTADAGTDALQLNNRCERRCELMEWCAAAWRFTAPCGTTPLQTTAALAELATDRYAAPDAAAVAKYAAAGEVPIISHFAKRVETAAAAAQAWADAVRDATEPAIPASPEVRTQLLTDLCVSNQVTLLLLW
jgi:hypothetical protein